MLIYIFLINFFVFAIIDYIYLYIFFDSKLFMNSLGTKLNYVLNLKSDLGKPSKKDVNKFLNFKKITSFIIIEIVTITINTIFFRKIIFSQFVVLDVGYKKIELVSTFENYWTMFIVVYYLMLCIFTYVVANKFMQAKLNKAKNILDKESFTVTSDMIYLGKSEEENVFINRKELYKNLLITGSIGTGKTRSAINKFVCHMIKNNLSGIIIDIKGNYVETVDKFIPKESNYEYIVISDLNNTKYNPINSEVRSLEMANRLRRVLELISKTSSSDPYWLDKVENVLFNILVLIKYTTPDRLDLKEIHELITDDDYLKEKIRSLKSKNILEILDNKVAHEISNVLMFFDKEYFKLENRILTIIKSEITRLTIPFVTDYEMCRRYGVSNKECVKISFTNCKPKLIVLSINMSRNFLISKILSTFIKLEFQSKVLENINNPMETFCICDEYQEFANQQDAHFLSLSREAKCMNIYSMQSYTSIINILNNENAAKVIIQNMVNKIWFRNDDNYTAEEIVKQIGKERKLLRNSSISEGAQETTKSIIKKGFKNKKSNISESITYVENIDYVIDTKLITRELENFEALVLIGKDGKMEEVKKVKIQEEECKYEKY